MVKLRASATLLFAVGAHVTTLCHAHGAMTFPRPRNALDASIAPWSNWTYPRDPIHFDYTGTDTAGSCPKTAHDGDADHLVSNGQACYWFSNGCTPGCPACDGTTSHVGHGGTRGPRAQEPRAQEPMGHGPTSHGPDGPQRPWTHRP